MADMEAIAASLTALLGSYGVTRDEFEVILSGPHDGGPDGNGLYPVTTANGATVKVPSLLKLLASGVAVDPALLAPLVTRAEIAASQALPAQAAKVDAEVARDQAKAYSGVAGTSAALAGIAQAAIEQAIAKVPTDSRLPIEAATMAVLRGVAADTPIGRLAYLAEPGREGIWQLRAGDYTARVAADSFGFRYVAMTAKSAAGQAWERVVAGGVFQATWTGLNAATPDALAMLRAATSLLDPYCVLQLPGFRMPVAGNDPRIPLGVPGTHLHGHGDASWIDYAGGGTTYWLLQAAADDVTISDLRASLVAPNDSAGNPACIMIGAHRTGDTPRPVRGVAVRDVFCDRTSLGIVAFVHAIDGNPSKGFIRPSGITISDARVVTNGVGVSLFGAQDAAVSRCALTYTETLPSNSPAAKRGGLRVLGTERAEISDVQVNGFPTGAYIDAAYVYGQRLFNRDVHFARGRFTDVKVPFEVFECRGELRIEDPVHRRSLTSTDRVTFIDIGTNLEVSALPGSFTELGDVTLRGFDCQGASVLLSQNGKMGHLRVTGGAVVGNMNPSNVDGQTGAVLCGGSAGWPESTTIIGNDFLMAIPAGAASPVIVGVNQPGDIITVADNTLPETSNPAAISAAGRPAFFSGNGIEQRPFTGRVNLGSNRLHRAGRLAQRRDGTPLPAPALPVVAPWARNFLGVTEGGANIFSKNAGTNGSYDAAVWSSQKLTSDFELVYRLGQVSNFLLVGLSNNPGAPALGGMDWSIEYQAGPATLVNNYAAQLAPTGSYDAGTIERWRRQGSRLIFSRGGVDMFDTAVSPERAFALQISFARINDAAEVLRFGAI